MSMSATLYRINPADFDYLEAGEPLPGEPEETVDVDVAWESLMFIFGNGQIGHPITGNIFMPAGKVQEAGEEYYDGPRYHTDEEIAAIDAMIGDLTKDEVREIIRTKDMSKVYRFHPDTTEGLVDRAMATITIFANAKKYRHVVVTSMG